MAMKSACVLALDVSCSNPDAFAKARGVCLQRALSALLFAPNDEVGLVLSGTKETRNLLATDDPTGARYQHITAVQEVTKANIELIEGLLRVDPAVPEKGKCDLLETLTVCAHQLHVATGKRKYARRIVLLTEAKDAVARKEDIVTVMDALKDTGVVVEVVGIDFTQAEANVQGSWEGLDTKAENERVLHYLCTSLAQSDGASAVVTLEDALREAEKLQRRKVLQRGLAKLVLSVGDIRIATQIYSKIAAEKVPPLKKVTSDGTAVGQVIEYTCAEGGGAADGQQPSRVGRDGLVKALRYGRSLIPCSDADVEAMSIKDPRALEGVCFARQGDIPSYIATGAAKSLLPLSGDVRGQRAFDVLVAAMLKRSVGLIVRYVQRANGKPALGVCMPAFEDSTRQYVLYYMPLPFTEDVRLYAFSEYADVAPEPAEEAMMETLVNAMSVDERSLAPEQTFNPDIHQYFATVQEKVVEAARQSIVGETERHSEVPELLPQLQRTSAAFTSRGNALEPLLRGAQPLLESCASAFPYVEVDPQAAGAMGGRGVAWFSAPAAAVVAGAISSVGAPTTVAAPALADGSEAPSTVSTVAATAGLSSARADRVNTVDPAGSFQAVMAGAQQDPVAKATAMDGLVDVVFELLRYSVKGSLFDKCDSCVRALRSHCVTEEEPVYFNKFLTQLQAVAQELGMGDAYWLEHIVNGTGTRPITRDECKSSDIANQKAANELLRMDCSLPPVDMGETDEDDIMDLIE